VQTCWVSRPRQRWRRQRRPHLADMITQSSSQKESAVTAQSNNRNVKVGIEQGAARLFVKAGGVLDIEPGGLSPRTARY
jgi:hypothetical protein